jgi:hypothetical protein
MNRVVTITAIALLQSACASNTAPESQPHTMITFEQIGSEIAVSYVSLQNGKERSAPVVAN